MEALDVPEIVPCTESATDSHTDAVYNMALTNEYLITCSKDTSVRVWSLTTRKLVHPPLQGHTESVLAIATNEPTSYFVSTGVDRRLIMWDLQTFRRVCIVDNAHTDSILGVAASSEYIVTASKDKLVKVWKEQKQREATTVEESSIQPDATLAGHRAAVNSVILTKTIIISGSGDRVIRLWDLHSKECIRTFDYHTQGITRLALSPLQTHLVSSSSDRTIRICNIETGEQIHCLEGHTELVRTICVVPKEGSEELDTIISGSYDGSVWVWERSQNDSGEDVWFVSKRYQASDVLPALENNERLRVFQVCSNGRKIFCSNTSPTIITWPLLMSDKQDELDYH